MRIALLICLMATGGALAGAANFPLEDSAFFANLETIRAQALAMRPPKQNHEAGQTTLTREEIYQKVLKSPASAKVPTPFIHDAIFDPNTHIIQEITQSFSHPAEELPYDEYRKIFITQENIDLGAQFYLDHQDLLSDVQLRYKTDPLILISLMGVESRYGGNTGKFPAVSALYTITAQLPNLSDWAANELAEYLELCYQNSFDVQSILGSYAGAFGYYQFMPSSYNEYAVDFDGDGLRSYDAWPDVLASVANYLSSNGYQPGDAFDPDSSIGKSIYSYNHSDNYVRVVLELRAAIAAKLKEAAKVQGSGAPL